MNESLELSDPKNYRILIQIKKNRKLKRKAKYLTGDFEFSEDITSAKIFKNLSEAELTIQKIACFSTVSARPRIVIRYVNPRIKHI